MNGALNPMQQLIALLSGTQMQQAPPTPPPVQAAQTAQFGAQPAATGQTSILPPPPPPPPSVQSTTTSTGIVGPGGVTGHWNHNGDWIADPDPNGGDGGDGHGHHGKGDKGDDTEEIPLTHIQQVMQDAIDTGPTGYIPAMRKNLGMNTPTIGYGDPAKNSRSAIATKNFMDLFMGGRNRGGA